MSRSDDAGSASADRPRGALAAQLPAAAAGRRRRDQPVRREGRRADAAHAEWLRGDDRGRSSRRKPRKFPTHGAPEDLAYSVASERCTSTACSTSSTSPTSSTAIRREVADTVLRADGPPRHRRPADRGVRLAARRPLAFVGAVGDSRRHLRRRCGRCASTCWPSASRTRRGEEKIAEWELTNRSRVAAGAAHARRDLRIRRARPRDAVGGGAPDPQHDAAPDRGTEVSG